MEGGQIFSPFIALESPVLSNPNEKMYYGSVEVQSRRHVWFLSFMTGRLIKTIGRIREMADILPFSMLCL